MKTQSLALLLLSLLFTHFGTAQWVSGVVLDSETREPVPFIAVVQKGQRNGTSTNMDGEFNLFLKEGKKVLQISGVGYYQVEQNAVPKQTILLRQKVERLDEVVITPGVNPADVLMERLIANRDKHNPENYESFEYNSYNKLTLSFLDSSVEELLSDTTDTMSLDIGKHLQGHHLFLTESYTHRKYKRPGLSNETVLANRVSGLKIPLFAWLPTQLQPFSFYDKTVQLAFEEYENPVAPNSPKRYLFIIEDTLYAGTDSLFVLSYRPKKGKYFASLEGMLTISTNGYALKNIIAKSRPDTTGVMTFKQVYSYQDSSAKWFPERLDFTYVDSTSGFTAGGRSSLTNVKIGTQNRNRDFNSISLKVDETSAKRDSVFWNTIRPAGLTNRELNTYTFNDSVGESVKLDEKMFIMKSLASGKIPIKFVDLNLREMMVFNLYEGLRLGVAPYTNDRFSKYFSLGGYWVYGFRDKHAKWGASVDFDLQTNNEWHVKIGYVDDVFTPGLDRPLEDGSPLIFDTYKYAFTNWRNAYQSAYASTRFRIFKFGLTELKYAQETFEFNKGYSYGPSFENGLLTGYSTTSYSARLRYSRNETRIEMFDNIFSVPGEKPVFWLSAEYGQLGEPQFEDSDFLRLGFAAKKQWKTHRLLKRYVFIEAGMTDSELPADKMHFSRGSFVNDFKVFAGETFQTMRLFEFIHSSHAAAFAECEVFRINTPIKEIAPVLSIFGAAGIGTYDFDVDKHVGIDPKTMEKGFYEVGAIAKDIFINNGSGLGIGAFYRLGEYGYTKQANNWAVKLAMTASF